jgi:hypothetical protein
MLKDEISEKSILKNVKKKNIQVNLQSGLAIEPTT